MLPVTFTQVKVLIKNSLQPLICALRKFLFKSDHLLNRTVHYREGHKKKTEGSFDLSELTS